MKHFMLVVLALFLLIETACASEMDTDKKTCGRQLIEKLSPVVSEIDSSVDGLTVLAWSVQEGRLYLNMEIEDESESWKRVMDNFHRELFEAKLFDTYLRLIASSIENSPGYYEFSVGIKPVDCK